MNTTTLHFAEEKALVPDTAPAPDATLMPNSTRPPALDAARRADLLDAEMLDTLSSDLREPLAIMKGSAETLLRRGERLSWEERHEFLSAIVQASERFEHVLQRWLPPNP